MEIVNSYISYFIILCTFYIDNNYLLQYIYNSYSHNIIYKIIQDNITKNISENVFIYRNGNGYFF